MELVLTGIVAVELRRARMWQLVQAVFTVRVPERQLSGVPGFPPDLATPPWQLTFEQENAVELNEDVPDSAL